ncbi:NAD-specific glutamate dehydrogenase [Lacticaseibacillus paracasei]|nr:NAD-specific glutamate dehydrogenase [Lacticaseibacillus paracasei]
MTKPWRNITTIWSDKKNCVFVFISVNLTGDSTVSALEMSQNSRRLSDSFEKVDGQLHDIMQHIFKASADAAAEYGMAGDYEAGANIAGFLKVADAMYYQGM